MHPLLASAMERMIAPMSSTPFAPRIRPSVSSFRRAATTAPAPRDWSVRSLNEHGRMNWRTTSGYHRRSKGEAAIGRSKRVSGDALRQVKIAVKVLNRILEIGRPIRVRGT
jgi:hypothetical protein